MNMIFVVERPKINLFWMVEQLRACSYFKTTMVSPSDHPRWVNGSDLVQQISLPSNDQTRLHLKLDCSEIEGRQELEKIGFKVLEVLA